MILAGGSVALADGSANDLIRQGLELRKAGDDRRALPLFQRAYAMDRTPRAAAQLGWAEQAIGRWEDAERHVSEALRATNDPWIAKHHADLDGSLRTIRAHTARVEITGLPKGAEVTVNGQAIGTLPLADSLSVSTGEVVIELRAPGYRPQTRTVTVSAAEYQRQYFSLEKERLSVTKAPPATTPSLPPQAIVVKPEPTPPVVTPAQPSPAPPPPGPSSPEPAPGLRRIAEWTALGLTAASAGVGVVATIINNQKGHAFQSANGGTCWDRDERAVNAAGSPLPSCQGVLSEYHTSRRWQVIGFVSAAAFATTAAILRLTEPGEESDTSRVALSCAPSLLQLGGFCQARF